MATQIDISDPRTAKALEILATSGGWAKVVTRSGDKFYGIESQSTPNLYHLTNARQCSCPDFQRRHLPCKHSIAVALLVATVRAHRRCNRGQVSEAVHHPRT